MKLLIITQKVDINDPILGFFHRWIEEFSRRYESLVVICLQKGAYNLPGGVRVFSLGKEHKELGIKNSAVWKKVTYVWNFYRLIWRERHGYDAGFVHMNQEYVLFGGLLWRALGKRILLWRNHMQGSFLTCISVWLSHQVFFTSPQSFTARFRNAHQMPVGIDTRFFRPDVTVSKKENSILFLGRIAPVKRIEIFIEALNSLKKEGIDFHAAIIGSALESGAEYQDMLHRKTKEYGLEKVVRFRGAVKQSEALRLYNEYEIFVNMTPSGSLDKTIFEAMACGSLILTGNSAFMNIVSYELKNKITYKEMDSADLARKIEELFKIPSFKKESIRKTLQEIAVNVHSLDMLMARLAEVMGA